MTPLPPHTPNQTAQGGWAGHETGPPQASSNPRARREPSAMEAEQRCRVATQGAHATPRSQRRPRNSLVTAVTVTTKHHWSARARTSAARAARRVGRRRARPETVCFAARKQTVYLSLCQPRARALRTSTPSMPLFWQNVTDDHRFFLATQTDHEVLRPRSVRAWWLRDVFAARRIDAPSASCWMAACCRGGDRWSNLSKS